MPHAVDACHRRLALYSCVMNIHIMDYCTVHAVHTALYIDDVHYPPRKRNDVQA
jgi:hypothetical protein